MLKTFMQYVQERKLQEDELPKDIEAARDKPGGSNVGKERESHVPKGAKYCGPAGGAPKGSYPVDDAGHAHSAIGYAHNAPNPAGIKKCAEKRLKELGN